jgi:hypothetical protein
MFLEFAQFFLEKSFILYKLWQKVTQTLQYVCSTYLNSVKSLKNLEIQFKNLEIQFKNLEIQFKNLI